MYIFNERPNRSETNMNPTSLIEVYSEISLPFLNIVQIMVVLAVALPLAAISGFVMGRKSRHRSLSKNEEIGSFVGETTLGAILALLGLLLAFSFGNTLSISNEDKRIMIEEAAALGTAFGRADYLPDPGRTELQLAIYEYAQTRLFEGFSAQSGLESVQTMLGISLEAQAKLWPLTLELTGDPLSPALKTFIAGSVNDVLDTHLRRTSTLSTPVSDLSQAMVLATALTALFLLGNRAGTLGRPLTWRTFVFSGFLFVVMMTITDIQRGEEGLVRMDDTALRATILEMNLALGGRT